MKIPLSLLIRQQVGRKVGLPFLEPGPSEVRLGCCDRNWTIGHWFPCWWHFKGCFRGSGGTLLGSRAEEGLVLLPKGFTNISQGQVRLCDDRATARKVIRGSWGKLFALQQDKLFSPEVWVRTSLTQPSPSFSRHWTQGRKDTNHSATARWKSVPKKSRPLPSWLEYAGGETNLDIELLKVVSVFSQFFLKEEFSNI